MTRSTRQAGAFLLVGFLLSCAIATIGVDLATAADDSQTAPTLQGGYLGLRHALELALKHHPFVQEGDAHRRAANARTEQARSSYYPQAYANLDASAGAGRINPRFMIGGFLVQPNLSQYVAGVSVNQRIYDFGYTQSLVGSSRLAETAQGEDVTARKALVVLTLERAYFTSLKKLRLVQIAEETVRERGVIKSQIESLYRQQLKSKLDLDLVQVELVNAESLLLKSRNELKASFADLNRAMGVEGPADYVLEDIPTRITPQRPLESLITEALAHPEFRKANELKESARAKETAMKRQYLPTVSAYASAGDFEAFDRSRTDQTGGWWAAGAFVSVPLFTGFLIEGQIREAKAQKDAAEAGRLNVQQALTQQVTTSYLETITLAQQIKLTEEQVKTAQEALQLARQRYKLGLGSIVEVTQSEVTLTAAQTRLAEAQYDYKIAEVTLAYAAGATNLSRAVESKP
jgi:outer membrane protein